MKRIAIVGAGNAGCITALELLQRRQPVETVMYHNIDKYPIERVGQGTLPTFTNIVYDVLGIDWYNNPIDATIKTGILYEGWGKKQYEIFHPFAMDNVASHFVPNKLSKIVRESGLVNVIEKTIQNPEKEIDADFIFDCRGRHNRDKDNYNKLNVPVNSVLLYSRHKLHSDTVPYTRAVATPNGWTFIIPLKDTVSYGYLYNSNITSEQEASEDFINRFNVSHVEECMKFESYHAKNMFIGERTILQGSAYGFVEPLEATAVNFYQDLYTQAAKYIFDNENKTKVNSKVEEMIKKIKTFLLWHYQFGSVYDTPFWEYAKNLPLSSENSFFTNNNTSIKNIPGIWQELGYRNNYGID